MSDGTFEVKAAPATKREIESNPARPYIAKVNHAALPEELRDYPQWILWTYEWHDARRQWTKIPIQLRPIGSKVRRFNAKANDPATWGTYEETLANYVLLEDAGKVGLGFVFTAADPFAGIDWDDCRDRRTGAIDPAVAAHLAALNAYTEVSPSGTGLKTILRGKKPGDRCQRKNPSPSVEMYDQGRWFALTGLHVPGTPAAMPSRLQELAALYAALFPAAVWAPRPLASENASGPVLGPANTSDDEVIRRLGAFKSGYKFDRLMRGDAGDYGGDKSAADFALAGMFAFYVGPDPVRIIGLMQGSGLRRPKWERADYLDRTVARAIAGTRSFFGDSSFPSEIDRELAGIDLGKIDFGLRPLAQASPPIGLTPTPTPAGGDGASTPAHYYDDLGQLARVVNEARASGELTDPWADSAAAAALRQERRDFDRFPCRRPLEVLLEHLRTKDLALIRKRCQKWDSSCRGCRAWLERRELAAVRVHFGRVFAAGEALYVVAVVAGQWGAVYKRIQRKGGSYWRCRDGDGYRVYTTANVAGSEPVADLETAIAACHGLLLLFAGAKRPVKTSHDWPLLDLRDASGEWRRRGRPVDPLKHDDMERIAEAYGLRVETKPGSDPTTVSFSVIRDSGKLPYHRHKALKESLIMGMYVEAFEPPPREPSLAEELDLAESP